MYLEKPQKFTGTIKLDVYGETVIKDGGDKRMRGHLEIFQSLSGGTGLFPEPEHLRVQTLHKLDPGHRM